MLDVFVAPAEANSSANCARLAKKTEALIIYDDKWLPKVSSQDSDGGERATC